MRVAFKRSTLSRTVPPSRSLSEPSGCGTLRGIGPGVIAEGGVGQPIAIGKAARRVRYRPNASCAGFVPGAAAPEAGVAVPDAEAAVFEGSFVSLMIAPPSS